VQYSWDACLKVDKMTKSYKISQERIKRFVQIARMLQEEGRHQNETNPKVLVSESASVYVDENSTLPTYVTNLGIWLKQETEVMANGKISENQLSTIAAFSLMLWVEANDVGQRSLS
jgi:hypothetical protein